VTRTADLGAVGATSRTAHVRTITSVRTNHFITSNVLYNIAGFDSFISAIFQII
jgi:hypothetical protein